MAAGGCSLSTRTRGTSCGTTVFPRQTSAAPRVSNNVVFTSTYAGTVYAIATATGQVLWRVRMPDGINGCPTVLGDTLLVDAGVPEHSGDRPEMVAFRSTDGVPPLWFTADMVERCLIST